MLNFNTEINNFELSSKKIEEDFAIKEFNNTQKYIIISSICTTFDNIFDSYQKNLPFVFYSLKNINDILCRNELSIKKYNQAFDELFIKRSGYCTKSTILTMNLGRLFNYKFESIKNLDEELKILRFNEKFSIKEIKRKKGRRNKIYELNLKLKKKLLLKKKKEQQKSQENEIHSLMSYCLKRVVEQLSRTDIFKEQCRNYDLRVIEREDGQIYLKGTISISPSKEKKFANEKGVVDFVPKEKKTISNNLPNLVEKTNKENLAEKKEVVDSSPRKSKEAKTSRRIGKKRVVEFASSKLQKPKKVRSNSLKSKTKKRNSGFASQHKKTKSNELPNIHKKLGNSIGKKRKTRFVAKLQKQKKGQSNKLPKIGQRNSGGFVSRVRKQAKDPHKRYNSI